MHLQTVGLSGRRFLIQYLEIITEFGAVIPWLDGMNDLRFATNARHFHDELLRRTRQRSGTITPYQFVDEGPARQFIGGVLRFSDSPEQLRDCRNCEVAERLTAAGASFISCLQVRPPHRGAGVGSRHFARALRVILRGHPVVWGVVSDRRLIPLYRWLGARTPSPLENRDGLWIVSWDRAHVIP